MPLFLGIDVGTQGVRIICSDQSGRIQASSSSPFTEEVWVKDLQAGYSEQHPLVWWRLVVECLQRTLTELSRAGYVPEDIAAVSVDSTSGTVIPVDNELKPLHPAIMYNDARSAQEAQQCNICGHNLCESLGFRFSSSFALPKILWLIKHKPRVISECYKIIHAADFINGQLTGDCRYSDYSNALKTGYDLIELKWPLFIESCCGIDLELLPEIVRPGASIGTINRSCAEATGLAEGTRVAAGSTDGSAGFLASGAARVGEWNTTLGTTMVLRGVSDKLISDPQGRLYCHLSPDGDWLPGGAGNVGGECLAKVFSGADYGMLDQLAMELSPTGVSVYPLVRKGERFPFVDDQAQGFVSVDNLPTPKLYAAYLEGVGYVERWAYEMVESVGAAVGERVYTTGGGARSVQWMQIRADILGRELVRPKVCESAMGAVILAGSAHFGSCAEAVRSMVELDIVVQPRAGMHSAYSAGYAQFREQCRARGLGE